VQIKNRARDLVVAYVASANARNILDGILLASSVSAILMSATSSTTSLAEVRNTGLANAMEHASARMDGVVTTAPAVLTSASVKTPQVG
jgi:hypothetical protein